MAKEARNRGQTYRDLQKVRDRLMSQTGTTPAFDYELLLTYSSHHQGSIIAVPVLGIAISCILMVWTTPIAAVCWLALVMAGHGAHLRLCRQFRQESAEDVNLVKWRRKFMYAETVAATSWATIVFLPVKPDMFVAASLVKIGVLLTVMAVRTMLSATVRNATYAATLPITALLIASFFGHPLMEILVMAGVAIFAQIFFIVLADRISTNAAAIQLVQAQNEVLISHLEEEKSKSDDARVRAEDANLAKTKFLATMSHELRTPLNAVLGFSEILKNESFGKHEIPQYKEYAEDIHRSGTHLLNLINEILDLSRIEAGRYRLREAPISLAEIVEDCCYMMNLRAKEKAISIIPQFEERMPNVLADEQAIRQVCLNLLSNAIKFTLSHGEVQVMCGWTSSGGQYVCVKDNGPGIPEDELELVLDAFGRGSSAHRNADEGAGLGLSIVQNLVELHQGQFSIKSKQRVGTEVMIILPAKRVVTTLPAIPGAQKSRPQKTQRAA